MAKKVLIVEDTDDIADALKILIEMQGYDAVVARDGFEGCRMAMDESPDLILMDLALPGMDGLEATREIRATPQGSNTPIVVVSSYAAGAKEQLLEAGCNEVLTKSSFISSFGPTLTRYLGKAEPAVSKQH